MPEPKISPAVLRYLFGHNWPGNVWELSHFAERVALGVDEKSIPSVFASNGSEESLPEKLERFESDLIRQALMANSGDVRSTLEVLKIPHKTFYDKLQRHGIDRAQYANGKDHSKGQ